MANWTKTEPNYDLIPNLYVQGVLKDGVLRYNEIYPCDGYVLHIPTCDSPLYDDDGNIVLDENGNAVIEPYYTWGGTTASATYDFVTNPEGYEAVLISELQ